MCTANRSSSIPTARLSFHQHYPFIYCQQVILHTYCQTVFPSTLPIFVLPTGHPPYLLPGCFSIHITHLSIANRSSSTPTACLTFHPLYLFLYYQQVILHTYYQTVFPSTLPIYLLPTGHLPYLLSGCLSINITYFCTANRSSSIPTTRLSFHQHYLFLYCQQDILHTYCKTVFPSTLPISVLPTGHPPYLLPGCLLSTLPISVLPTGHTPYLLPDCLSINITYFCTANRSSSLPTTRLSFHPHYLFLYCQQDILHTYCQTVFPSTLPISVLPTGHPPYLLPGCLFIHITYFCTANRSSSIPTARLSFHQHYLFLYCQQVILHTYCQTVFPSTLPIFVLPTGHPPYLLPGCLSIHITHLSTANRSSSTPTACLTFHPLYLFLYYQQVILHTYYQTVFPSTLPIYLLPTGHLPYLLSGCLSINITYFCTANRSSSTPTIRLSFHQHYLFLYYQQVILHTYYQTVFPSTSPIYLLPTGHPPYLLSGCLSINITYFCTANRSSSIPTTRLSFHQHYLFLYCQQVILHTYCQTVFPSTLPISVLPTGHPPYLLPDCLSINITYFCTANRSSSIPTTRLSFHHITHLSTANRPSSIPTIRLSFHQHYLFLYCQQVILHTYYQAVFPSTLPISVLPTGHPPNLLPGCLFIHITYFCTANRSSSIPTARLSFHQHYLFLYCQQVILHTYYQTVFPSTSPIYLLPTGHPPYLLPGCLSINITYFCTANRSSSLPTTRLSFHPHYLFLYCQQVILHTYCQTVFPSTLHISVLPTGHPPYLLPYCLSINITYFCTANRSSSITTTRLSFHPHYPFIYCQQVILHTYCLPDFPSTLPISVLPTGHPPHLLPDCVSIHITHLSTANRPSSIPTIRLSFHQHYLFLYCQQVILHTYYQAVFPSTLPISVLPTGHPPHLLPDCVSIHITHLSTANRPSSIPTTRLSFHQHYLFLYYQHVILHTYYQTVFPSTSPIYLLPTGHPPYLLSDCLSINITYFCTANRSSSIPTTRLSFHQHYLFLYCQQDILHTYCKTVFPSTLPISVLPTGHPPYLLPGCLLSTLPIYVLPTGHPPYLLPGCLSINITYFCTANRSSSIPTARLCFHPHYLFLYCQQDILHTYYQAVFYPH